MAWVVCVLLLKKQNNYMSEVSQVSWKIKRKNLEVFSYVSNLGYETINNKKKKKGKVHFIYLWFGPFTSCLPVISKLTLCPLEVLFVNFCYSHLTTFFTKKDLGPLLLSHTRWTRYPYSSLETLTRSSNQPSLDIKLSGEQWRWNV